MKRIVALLLVCLMVSTMCFSSFAVEREHDDEIISPPGVVLYEDEIWVPASEDNMAPREAPNAACDKTAHIPPAGYRYVGYKRGNTKIDNFQATASGFLVSLLIPSDPITKPFIALVGLIGVGIAMDPSEIQGDYTIYTWSNGTNTWSHVVAYATYTTAGGKTITEYVNCEVRTS